MKKGKYLLENHRSYRTKKEKAHYIMDSIRENEIDSRISKAEPEFAVVVGGDRYGNTNGVQIDGWDNKRIRFSDGTEKMACYVSIIGYDDSMMGFPLDGTYTKEEAEILMNDGLQWAISEDSYANISESPAAGDVIAIKFREQNIIWTKNTGMKYEDLFLGGFLEEASSLSKLFKGKTGTLGDENLSGHATKYENAKCRPRTDGIHTAVEILKAYPRAKKVVDKVIKLAARLSTKENQVDPAWVANAINKESQWDPKSKNPKSGASGLIQWMPSTLRRANYKLEKDTKSGKYKKGTVVTTDVILDMTEEEQWPYVEKYFISNAPRGKIKSGADFSMAIFSPASIGKGPDFDTAVPWANEKINGKPRWTRYKGANEEEKRQAAYKFYEKQNYNIRTKADYYNMLASNSKLADFWCDDFNK